MAAIKIDPELLSFGDLEDFENATGSQLMALFDGGGKDFMSRLSATQLVHLIWICGRTDDPTFTVDDARKVRLKDLDVAEDSEPDPTDGSAISS